MNRKLTETEKRIYLIFSIIFEKIMDEAAGYQQGTYQWNLLRPSLMQSIGLDDEIWESMSDTGDEDPDIQEELAILRQKYEKLSKDEIIRDFSSIFTAK
ncbi:MAG: hypothetical protein ACFFD1_08065 [Candidatus Thorarchaeota archaeon]